VSQSCTYKLNSRIETTVEGVNKFYCTFIHHDYLFKYGLLGAVIIGEVEKSDSGEMDFKNTFKENPLFKKTIFNFIEIEAINDPALITEAKKQNNGWVYIVDQRTPTPEGEVPPFDIIGAFEVTNGKLGNFNANQNYQLKSVNGFTNFGETLNIKMNNYLTKLLQKNA